MTKADRLTRREAMQGMLGAAVTSMVPVGSYAQQLNKSAALSLAANPERLMAFNDNWRFHRGDAQGAEASDFNDASWRLLHVPHDWSIEDVPGGEETAIWSEGTNPIRVGPFDLNA